MYKHTKTGCMKDNMATIPVTIDEKTKINFHELCIKNKTTMSKVVRGFINNYIAEHKPRYVQVG